MLRGKLSSLVVYADSFFSEIEFQLHFDAKDSDYKETKLKLK